MIWPAKNNWPTKNKFGQPKTNLASQKPIWPAKDWPKMNWLAKKLWPAKCFVPTQKEFGRPKYFGAQCPGKMLWHSIFKMLWHC